jgi:AcrR family transcriptional regulator
MTKADVSNRSNLKNEIIITSIEIAKEKGWSSVSVRKISDRVNYSTIIIYSEFGNKEALINEIKEFGFKKLLLMLYKVCEEKEKNRELVKQITNTTLDFYFQNKELYQIMFGVVGLQGVKNECVENSNSSKASSLLKDILSEILIGDPQSLFLNWWALIHGFISIGTTIEDTKFKAMLPYLDEAIDRFMK